MNDYKKVLVRLTTKQNEVLAAKAKKYSVSKNFLIRKAIAEYLGKKETGVLEVKASDE